MKRNAGGDHGGNTCHFGPPGSSRHIRPRLAPRCQPPRVHSSGEGSRSVTALLGELSCTILWGKVVWKVRIQFCRESRKQACSQLDKTIGSQPNHRLSTFLTWPPWPPWRRLIRNRPSVSLGTGSLQAAPKSQTPRQHSRKCLGHPVAKRHFLRRFRRESAPFCLTCAEYVIMICSTFLFFIQTGIRTVKTCLLGVGQRRQKHMICCGYWSSCRPHLLHSCVRCFQSARLRLGD